MIHVCFCMTDETGRYSKFVGTSMHSIFENTSSPVTVHILHDNTLTADNREKFSYLAGRYSQAVKFHNVGEMYADKISEMKNLFRDVEQSRFTVGMFYRFFIPQALPKNVEKAIYLDGDIIVNLDINELWEIELDNHPLGVVPEILNKADPENFSRLVTDGLVEIEKYFNSGVLLMNLNFLRQEETLLAGIEFIGKNSEYSRYPDQSILNYCFSSGALALPVKFNSLVKNLRHIDRELKGAVYHYAGLLAGLGLKMNDPFNRLWMRHFLQTPWFDEDSIGRLYSVFSETSNDLKKFALKLSALVSGKTRGFCARADQVDEIKKIFGVRDDEVIVLLQDRDSVKNLIATMRRLKGKVVFFIMMKRFSDGRMFPFKMLSKRDFVEGEDFVKGWEYLDPPLKAHSLINAL